MFKRRVKQYPSEEGIFYTATFHAMNALTPIVKEIHQLPTKDRKYLYSGVWGNVIEKMENDAVLISAYAVMAYNSLNSNDANIPDNHIPFVYIDNDEVSSRKKELLSSIPGEYSDESKILYIYKVAKEVIDNSDYFTKRDEIYVMDIILNITGATPVENQKNMKLMNKRKDLVNRVIDKMSLLRDKH